MYARYRWHSAGVGVTVFAVSDAAAACITWPWHLRRVVR
jgi:hypothetical protein